MSSRPASTEELRAIEFRRESGVFPKRPVSIVRGRGVRLWDAEGREFLDFGANYGVANVGHAHPAVARAIAEQAERLIAIPQTYHNDRRAELLERLARVAPPGLERSFLANSGTEAIEAAIKFARGVTRRSGLVAAKKAFHGRTMGALSLTFKPEYRDPFVPLLPGASHVSFGDEEALKAAVSRETAAVFLEPIQGEGGVHVAPNGYLKAARDVAHDAGALLVLDEVQTGFGRTGRFWACDHDGVAPDVLCFAKAVAGGLPMGGLLLRDDAAKLPPASHGNTFGGSPLACAAAIAVLDVIEREGLVANAARQGARLLAGLGGIASPLVREARGRGLMVGLELRSKNTPVLNALVAERVLTLPTGATVIRYLPPLVATADDVDLALAATAKALDAASRAGADA